MVATRRMAPKGSEVDMVLDQDPELALRKKPVRRATAKTTKTETKPRSTRGRKAAIEPEVQEDEPVEDSEPPKPVKRTVTRAKKQAIDSSVVTDETSEIAVSTRSTRAGSVRGKKDAVTVQQNPEPLPFEETKQSRSTKTGSVRGRKAAIAVDDAPSLPAPEPKPTRQTRTAASKAQPLSPKKITQVSKPATRATKDATQKPMGKAKLTKGPAKPRDTTKRRAVSDENADVADMTAPLEQEVIEVFQVSTSPMKSRAIRNKVFKRDEAIESEASMSSRPTTPNDSARNSFVQSEEDIEEQQEDDSVSVGPQSIKDDSEASEDELCGPKTPMKRSSPSAEAKYHASAQRTIRKYDDELSMRTPARRFKVLGSQRGTPQTQKVYCKPAAPSSASKLMTVSRGSDRSSVFKDPRDDAPSSEHEEPADADSNDLSFIPDDDIIPLDNDHDSANPSPSVVAHAQLRSSPQPASDMNNDEMDIETSYQSQDEPSYQFDESGFIDPALVEPDPEETVLLQDFSSRETSPVAQLSESFETEDTVIIARPEQVNVDEEMSDDESASDTASVIHETSAVSPAAQSTPWELHKHALPISVNFDEHLADARISPSKELAGPLWMTNLAKPAAQDEDHTVAGAEMDIDLEPAIAEQPSRRQTVNFNDFIDVEALAEPSVILEASQIETLAEQTDDMEVETTDLVGDPVMHETSLGAEHDAVTDTDVEDSHVKALEQVDEMVDEVDTQQYSETPKQTEATDADETLAETEAKQGDVIPHYALPTVAFDARRKSLPAIDHRTPVRVGNRPNTSDGASMPRIVNPFANAWWARSRAGSTATTPVKSRPSTADATNTTTSKFNTPAKSPAAKIPTVTPKERFPRLGARSTYEEHARTVAAPVRFQTPVEKSPKRRDTFHRAITGQMKHKEASANSETVITPQATPVERYPRMKPRENYEEHSKTVAAPVRFANPANKSPKRRDTFHKALPGQVKSNKPPTTPTIPSATVTPQVTPGERYPRLGARQNYEEHAKTVAAPARFHTPIKTPLKRPATTRKPESLRKAALKANTPLASHTPMKTPLKAPAMTPSQAPMTPHPAAPLRGIVALVEVFTLEGASASAPFIALLHRLRAKTTKAWSDRVTHVVFKDGSPTTLQRVRLNNKEVQEKGTGNSIHCVNSRWVNDCDTEGTRMDESDEAYVVDVAEVPRGGKRRRKSMEPSALMNVGGNIVRDRKSSIGRRVSSLGRSPLKFDSSAKEAAVDTQATPKADVVMKENNVEEQGSPATPAWISAPDQLVQQTAPMNRIRKLEIQGGKEAKNRRLTFWNGGA